MDRRTIAEQDRRRRTYRLLIGIILATLPCYFCGIVLLVGFSPQGREPTPTLTSTLAETATITLTPSQTATITPTYTPGGPTVTLPFTPTQFFPSTRTPSPSASPTITETSTLTPTETPTQTPDLNATATTNALLTQAAQTQIALSITPTNTLTNTPEPDVNFSVAYHSSWTCVGSGRVTFQVTNTGNLALESMSYSLEGPPGTLIASGNSNAPFRSGPQDSPACLLPGGAESLAVGLSSFVYLEGTAPAAGTAGKLTIRFCSQNGLSGTCRNVTVDFIY